MSLLRQNQLPLVERASVQVMRGPCAGLVFLGVRAAMWRLFEQLNRHRDADLTFQLDERL